VIEKLNTAMNAGLESPEMRASLAKLGVEPKIQTPRELQVALIDEVQQ